MRLITFAFCAAALGVNEAASLDLLGTLKELSAEQKIAAAEDGTTTTTGSGGTTTTTGSGTPVIASFYLDPTCTKAAFTINVTTCLDISQELALACKSLSIPTLLCPYASINAKCFSNGVDGTVYFGEIPGSGSTCNPDDLNVQIPLLSPNTCFSLGIGDVGLGFEANC